MVTQRKKILCLMHEGSPMALDCFEAFQKQDCVVQRYMIKGKIATEGKVSFDYNAFLESLLLFLPDILFVLNANGLDAFGAIASICREKNCRIVTWFNDNPFYSYANWKDMCGMKNVYFFSWDKHYIPALKQHHALVSYLPFATNTDRFYPREMKNEDKRFRSHLAFVGSLGAEVYLRMLDDFQKTYFPGQAGLEDAFIRAAHKAIANNTFEAKEIFEEADSPFFHDGLFLKNKNLFYGAQRILEFILTMLIRRTVIKTLIPSGLRVWGIDEWKECVPEEAFMGPVNYLQDAAKVYSFTDINIDVSRFQQRKGTTLRVFDVPAAGSFLITDYKESLFELFDKDEIVCYRDTDECEKLVKFYDNKPDLRKMIAKRAGKRVQEEHTYDKRMQAVIQEVFECEDKPEIKGTTSQKEITAWQSYFNGIIRDKTGDRQGAQDAFKKAVSLCGDIKGALSRR